MKNLLFFLYFVVGTAFACGQCLPEDVEKKFRRYENVLLVRISSASLSESGNSVWNPEAKRQLPLAGTVRAKYEVMYNFKGDSLPETLYVSESMCSKALLAVGGVYLVFTNNGHLSRCGGLTQIYSMKKQSELLISVLQVSKKSI